MGILIQPKRLSTQPLVGSRINWGHPLARGLVGCWLCNEFGGKLLNDAALSSHGTLSGSTLPIWTTSPYGGALSFDGVTNSNYVDLGAKPVMNCPGEMTVMAFIKPATATVVRQIAANYNVSGTASQWTINMSTAKKVVFQHVLSGSQLQATGGTVLSLNTWYRVGAVRTGGTGNWAARVYVNGIDDGGTTSANNPATQQTTAIGRIGADSSDGQVFSGLISDVFLWNRALTPSEMQWLYVEPYAFMQPARLIPAKRVDFDEGYPFHYHR